MTAQRWSQTTEVTGLNIVNKTNAFSNWNLLQPNTLIARTPERWA